MGAGADVAGPHRTSPLDAPHPRQASKRERITTDASSAPSADQGLVSAVGSLSAVGSVSAWHHGSRS
ncbi:MAG: hypothetical protein M3Y71_08560 [Actinomycetota bacterium]|nr:hypothetical protein [Actinomycetota bacterium]